LALGPTREELIAQGLKPCPNCGTFYNPNDPKVELWVCSICGVDLTLSPEEAAKARLSDEELAAQMKEWNAKARKMKTLAIGCSVACFLSCNPFLWPFVIPTIIAAIIFAFKFAGAHTKAKNLLAYHLTLDVITEVFDEVTYAALVRPADEILREPNVIQRWDRANGSDTVTGKYKGHTILFCDIELEAEYESEDSDGHSSKDYITVFKGQWLMCELGREVPAKLRLRENEEFTGKVSKKIFGERTKYESDIQTENMEFNKRFQILTKDEHSAFYILTPHFMEFIINADDAADSQIYLSFMEKRVYILLHNWKDSFELNTGDGDNLPALRERMRSELKFITSILDELFKNEYLFGSGGD